MRRPAGLEPLFGMLIAAWVFYMAFEAYHTAKRRRLGQPVENSRASCRRAGAPIRHFRPGPRF